MNIKEARIRVKAKDFKSRIGVGLCMNIPNDIIDSLKNDEIELFFKSCKRIGLEMIKEPSYLYGKWQKVY